MKPDPIRDIDEYIASCPAEVQNILQQVRQAIREAAPEATEKISYQMPAFAMNGRTLVYFAAWKKHIGFYPHGSKLEPLQAELEGFTRSKGAIQFPLEEPMPLELIQKIVRLRLEEQTR
jgi:uncharacterized protein YdhG (YjbR/CyaY superfamily)